MLRRDHERPKGASVARRLLMEICAGLDLAQPLERVRFHEVGDLASAFPVSDFAAAAMGAAGLAASQLIHALFGDSPPVSVDRRLASAWFGLSIHPIGWSAPPPWDPIAGDYEARDGWIRLHTNAPHHREAALRVLGCASEKAAVIAAVRQWSTNDLESAIVARCGCAATMRSLDEWSTHPQGAAVAQEPIARVERSGPSSSATWDGRRNRPLHGLRVLDCTRVLAGPVATRFLAGLGAEVLRIDPPVWDEPAITPEVTLGKRCARLDIKTREGRKRFVALLGDADLFIHGLRPDALDALDLGAEARERIRPGLIDVALDAYGWTGPWAGRSRSCRCRHFWWIAWRKGGSWAWLSGKSRCWGVDVESGPIVRPHQRPERARTTLTPSLRRRFRELGFDVRASFPTRIEPDPHESAGADRSAQKIIRIGP
jgi:CoA-transferase family III